MDTEGVGFICCLVAGLCFGSNFVPVKKFETGDGLFFQWIMCVAIWGSGLVVYIARGFPPFEPLAMLGGFLWCTGNVMVVPIVKMIGLSLGMLLWGTANLVMGWSSGTFGLFGLQKETVSLPSLNYVGVIIALVAIALYAFVKPEESGKAPATKEEQERLINTEIDPVDTMKWLENMPPAWKRVLGIALSVISGIFYGVNFDPPQWRKEHGGPDNLLDYVFPHFCGIFVTSTLYFLIYCAVMKNKPILYPQCVLPGIVSGALWAIADISWFVANQYLNFNVAFPLITTLPGIVATLWGVIVFKEIRGARNFIVLAVAFICSFVAVTLITLSKVL